MLGAIIGDIIGSRFEWHNIKTKEFELFVKECRPTDDSIMTLAIAKALLCCDGRDFSQLGEQTVRCMQRIGRKYPLVGYGKKFTFWLMSLNPQPYNSLGNGAAMRVSPCAYVAETLDEALELAKTVTEVTHNHPEGIKGTQATVAAVFLALHGSSMAEIREHIDRNYYPMNFTLDEIRPTYKIDGSCQGTVPQAITAFLESTSFEDAIRNAISIGGDSDTIAAITGSIAGAYYDIPEMFRLLITPFLDEFQLGIIKRFESRYGKRRPCDHSCMASGKTAKESICEKSETEENRPDTICMADGTQVKTLEELREHFDLISVLEHYTNGKLLEWLENLHYEEEAAAVAAMNPFMDEFEEALCALLGVPFSLDEMIRIYEKAANENNAEAQFRFGCCYMFFHGIIHSRGAKAKTRNHKKMLKGVEWIRRAADQGHPFAQYSLGNFYHYEQRNKKDANIWYQKAADQGYIEAQYSLGTLESCMKAAAHGHIRAKVRIGNIYYKKGSVENDRKAVKWYREAAEQGNVEAAYKLCLCYLTGRGVDKDDTEALKWCEAACSADNLSAMVGIAAGDPEDSMTGVNAKSIMMAAFRIGEWYFYGFYVEPNLREAAKWYHRAFLEGEHWRIANKLDLCLALFTDAELAYKHDEPPETLRGVLGQRYLEDTAVIANRDYNANVSMLRGNDQICPAYMCYIPEESEENDMAELRRYRANR